MFIRIFEIKWGITSDFSGMSLKLKPLIKLNSVRGNRLIFKLWWFAKLRKANCKSPNSYRPIILAFNIPTIVTTKVNPEIALK